MKYRQFHRFINRGFLIGPILPIYGSGAAAITLVINAVCGAEPSSAEVFLISFVLCGTLEYLVSYYMEKRFHARWWDYSQKPMNLHGRVWIGNLMLFGLAGVLIIQAADPLLFRLLDGISMKVKQITAGVLCCVLTADIITSHFVMKLVKQGVENSEADNTEQISKEIHTLLTDRSVFHRRFAEAYPEVIYKTDRIAARMEEVRRETERIRLRIETKADDIAVKVDELKDQIATELEPTIRIKNTILQKQDELIGMIYDPDTAPQEAVQLMDEIIEKKQIIADRHILFKALKRKEAEND